MHEYGKHILRLLVAVLYFLASAHLMTRWMFDGNVAEHWVKILVSRGVDIGVPWVAVSLRLMLMVVGSVAALVFLLKDPQRKSNDGPDERLPEVLSPGESNQ